ncbi:MAG: nucleoside-diphosphate kinase [Nitrospinae bacterium]|nr:nucleoside-diphosphate kinase [Nitrospinota bacterium]
MEKTLAIIKPDAVERNLIGKILARVEAEGFKIAAMKMAHLSKREAQGFYYVHKQRAFFDDLTTYMSSGPVVILALRRENAVPKWREIMGATNPAEAAPGTLRKELGLNIEKNSTHGSDSPDNAAFEISYFFSQANIHG